MAPFSCLSLDDEAKKYSNKKITQRVVGDKCKPAEYPTLPYCYMTNKLFSAGFRVNHIMSNLQPLEELFQMIRLHIWRNDTQDMFSKRRRAWFHFGKGKSSLICTLFNTHIFSNRFHHRQWCLLIRYHGHFSHYYAPHHICCAAALKQTHFYHFL